VIWKQSAPNSPWQPQVGAIQSHHRTVIFILESNSFIFKVMKVFDAPVWRVSWSVTGNVLAVSTGDHNVTLWKQAVDESWVQISSIER
jgi:protein transport protein SEC13